MAKLQIKKSNETGKVPQPSDLDWGELALNYTDGKLFYKKHGTNTVELLTSVTRLRGTTSGTYTSGDLTLVAGTNITITQSGSDYTIASAGGADSTKLPLAGGTLTGTLNFNSADQSAILQHDGTATAWYGRLLVKNATADISSFLGNYNSKAGVFAHNNALTAWAPLYVNTLGNNGGGTVYLPHNATYTLSGDNTAYAILNAGNYNSYALPLTGGTLTGALSITDATQSTSTSTGALKITGGVGVAKNLYVGGTLVDIGNTTTNPWSIQQTQTEAWKVLQVGTVSVSQAYLSPGHAVIGVNIYWDGNTWRRKEAGYANRISFGNGGTLWLTSPSSGSADSFVTDFSESFYIDGSGYVQVLNTQQSTSTTTGSFRVAGGVGVGKNLYVGGTLSVSLDASIYDLTIGRGAGAVFSNTALGQSALAANTTGDNNTATGQSVMYHNTSGASNVANGVDALFYNQTGSNNVAVGKSALVYNTTASNNTAVGYQAGYSNQTGTSNVAIGYKAGYSNNSNGYNTFVGDRSGTNSTGQNNTFIGQESGNLVTSGAKNTILGRYNGNQGGLDIRTASNYIVLSDGDGNPRIVVNESGNTGVGNLAPTEKLDVAGNIKHTGLTMTAGTNVDQIYTHQQNITLTTGWQDTGVNAAELATGSYIVQVVAVSDYTVGGGHYDEYYTGVMSWFASNTNSTMSDEIALHRAGHAPNNGTIFLRVIRTVGADPDDLKLQIAGTTTNSAAYQYTFKFRRLI